MLRMPGPRGAACVALSELFVRFVSFVLRVFFLIGLGLCGVRSLVVTIGCLEVET